MFDDTVLSSLPNRPLHNSEIIALNSREEIGAVTPVAADMKPTGQFIFAFVLTANGTTYAIAFDSDDGNGSWKTVKTSDTVEDAFLYLQVWMENKAGRFD